jgi:hypothetical protein
MLTRRYGTPLLRGVLTAGLASQRGEDAAAPSVAGWPVLSSPLSTGLFPGIPGGGGVAARLLPCPERWW